LLSDPRLRSQSAFEYSRRPVRAGLKTYLTVLWPQRFWRGIPLELATVPERLRAFHRLAIVIMLTGLLFYLCAAAVERRTGAALTIILLIVALPLLTSFTLPRFAPSLAKFEVRRDRLARIWAFGRAGGAWLGLALALAAIIGQITVPGPGWRRPWPAEGFNVFAFADALVHGSDLSWIYRRRWWSGPALAANTATGVVVFALVFAWWWLFLYAALRGHLRMDRVTAFALCASTQIIALLVIGLLLVIPLLLTEDGIQLLADT
jgi:hypothetical protein